MDRGAWWVTVHRVTIVGHDLATQPPPPSSFYGWKYFIRRTCAHLLLQELQNHSSLVNNHQQENVGSHRKKIPHVQGQRRSPSKMVGDVKLCLESNPIPTIDARRARTKPCAPQRDWARPAWVCECLLWRYKSVVAWRRGRGSGCSRSGYGLSPLRGGHHEPHHRAAWTYSGLGK